MRQSLEKKLALLVQESVENKQKLKEQKYAVRYHKVRFFERIKLERKIGKLQKSLKGAEDDEQRNASRRKLEQAREDLEYVLHFPKGEKYVSLLKDTDDAEAQAHLQNERERLRAIVKQQLRDEAIVNELDEGEGKNEKMDEIEDDGGEGTFEQEIREDDFFANSSDEDIDHIRCGGSGDIGRVRGSDDEDNEDDGVLDGLVGQLSEDERENMAAYMDTSSSDSDPRDPEAEDKGKSEDEDDSGHRAFQKQAQPSRWQHGGKGRSLNNNNTPKSSKSTTPKTKSKMNAKTNSKATAKRGSSAKKQPVRTRAEGGRKRRKKK